MIRYPASLDLFLGRVWRVELCLACLQLMHLLFLSNARQEDFVAWLVVHFVAQASLWVLRNAVTDGPSYLRLPWRPLVLLFVISMIFKLSSRAPIIAVWLADGLRATRDSDELAGGSGLASFANIFFYPVAILLAFTTLPRRVYRVLMMCVILLCMIDLVVLGTRNAPVFVLFFHLLSIPIRFGARRVFVLLLLAVGFVSIFSYSTVNRTLEASQGKFDWVVLFDSTSSTEVLRLNSEAVKSISHNAPALLPAVFLSHYLTHSIAELGYLIALHDKLKLGTAAYLIDQACGIGICSRDESQGAIMRVNPRAGVYQTIWGSLFFDFGFGGAIAVWILALGAVVLLRLMRARVSVIMVSLAAVVVTLGMVENYLYNGLGLAQVLTILLAYAMIHFIGAAGESR